MQDKDEIKANDTSAKRRNTNHVSVGERKEDITLEWKKGKENPVERKVKARNYWWRETKREEEVDQKEEASFLP